MDAKVQVYAVVRIDEFLSRRDAITVKEILPTLEQAEKEVERLNELNRDKGCYYFWQAARYFPEGRDLNEDGGLPKHSSHIPSLPGSES
jgi:hypothetical protein